MRNGKRKMHIHFPAQSSTSASRAASCPPALTFIRIGLVGAGLIGKKHIATAHLNADAEIIAIADPGDAAASLASEEGLPWFATHREMLQACDLDAAIVCAPNALHRTIGIDCLGAGLATLIEKPICDTVADGVALVSAARDADLPLLVGHQRRYNASVQRAKELVEDGLLGRPVTASVMALMYKPDDYFDLKWRTVEGGGPILINLIHEIDQLRFICGEVSAVNAATSSATRNLEVEDSGAFILEFVNGMLATISLSDTAVCPWTWDQLTSDQPHFARSYGSNFFLAGSEGSLSMPDMTHFRYRGAKSWLEPLQQSSESVAWRDPYIEQLRHFIAVIRGSEQPISSGLDGLRTLEVLQACRTAAQTGMRVAITPFV